MGRKNHINFLKNFKRKLSAKIPVERMILFGSRAYGKPHRWSDVDLIVVANRFKGKGLLDRSPNLYMKWNINYPVDFLCYTPEEFNKLKKQVTIVREAVKHGIEI